MPLIKNQDIRIFYEVVGRGQPLVLLHGFAGNSKDWKRNGYVETLSDDYQLILIDERGHGLSDKPHDPAAYEMQKRASDIVAVLEDLNLKKTPVWGYSMGGEVCFGLAQFYSDCKALIASTIAARDWSGCEDILETLEIPCLIYVGETDSFMFDSVKRGASQIPEAKFVIIPGRDHGQAYADSHLILPHVRDFLRKKGMNANEQ